MKASKHYFSLDIAKFICSLLIIVIHACPFSESLFIAKFYVCNVLARIAVPIFYAISGFLFFGRLIIWEDGKIKRCPENFARLIRYIKHNGLIYISWSCIYILSMLPRWYEIGWWGIGTIKDCIASFFFVGTYYHLWFLLSLIYAVPILYILMTFVKQTKVTIILSVLWLCELLVYSYAWIGVDQLPFINWLQQHMPIVFDSIFRAIPLLGIGALCLSNRNCINKYSAGVKAIIAFVACAIEASILFFFIHNTEFLSYLFLTPVFTYYFMQFLLNYNPHNISTNTLYMLRQMSSVIYCVHPLVISFCQHLSIPTGVLLWLTVTVVSIILAFLWSRLRLSLNSRKLN